jgi:chromosome segregation ATPase
VSETTAPHLLGALVTTPSVGRRPGPLRGRRKIARLQDQLAAQEHELLRRQNSLLALARDAAKLREELTSMTRERDLLGRRLDEVTALRAAEAAQARRLADAVLDQQAVVAELERATAGLFSLR